MIPKEIIASVDNGIYAVNFGGGQVDITSGKFVFTMDEAWKIEDGKLMYPIKGRHADRQRPDAHPSHHDRQRHGARRRHWRLRQGRPDVPVGIGQPTLRIEGPTVGGTA